MDKRDTGYDFIRVFAIFTVFVAHALAEQISGPVRIALLALSPGLTMSLLGFISGNLLTTRYDSFDGRFYVRRFARIYSSLAVCLVPIVLFHAYLSYDVLNRDSVLHLMGLTLFMDLLQVENGSTIGTGLWFITVINVMYLVLPLKKTVYGHRHAKAHLVLVILSCLFLDEVVYGISSAWNVAISFTIGCYIGLNSDIKALSKHPLVFYVAGTVALLLVCGLARAEVIPDRIRGFLPPFYPFFVVPLLYRVGNHLNTYVKSGVVWLSSISYEVYILHFYFINEHFSDVFPSVTSAYLQLILALLAVVPLAAITSRLSAWLGKKAGLYLTAQERRS